MDEAETAARRIYEEWHAGFNEGNLERVMAVYAEHATIETPAVLSVYPDAKEGILHGRVQIRELFARNLQNLPSSFSGLYRTGLFFSNGRYLTWEYPRLTPGTPQLDLFESMDVEGGLCVYHRVYWGWRGMQTLMATRERTLAAQSVGARPT